MDVRIPILEWKTCFPDTLGMCSFRDLVFFAWNTMVFISFMKIVKNHENPSKIEILTSIVFSVAFDCSKTAVDSVLVQLSFSRSRHRLFSPSENRYSSEMIWDRAHRGSRRCRDVGDGLREGSLGVQMCHVLLRKTVTLHLQKSLIFHWFSMKNHDFSILPTLATLSSVLCWREGYSWRLGTLWRSKSTGRLS